MEKKRRDRINKSLDELKDLMALTDEVVVEFIFQRNMFIFFFFTFFNSEQDIKN